MKICEKRRDVVYVSAVRRSSSVLEPTAPFHPTPTPLGQYVGHAARYQDPMSQTVQGGEEDEPTEITNHSPTLRVDSRTIRTPVVGRDLQIFIAQIRILSNIRMILSKIG